MNENSYNIIKVNNYYTLTGKLAKFLRNLRPGQYFLYLKFFHDIFQGHLRHIKERQRVERVREKAIPEKTAGNNITSLMYRQIVRCE